MLVKICVYLGGALHMRLRSESGGGTRKKKNYIHQIFKPEIYFEKLNFLELFFFFSVLFLTWKQDEEGACKKLEN